MRSSGSPPRTILFNSITIDRQEKKKKAVPWLSFSSSRSDWHVLQRRCQPTPTPIYITCLTASVPTEANYYIHFFRRGREQATNSQFINYQVLKSKLLISQVLKVHSLVSLFLEVAFCFMCCRILYPMRSPETRVCLLFASCVSPGGRGERDAVFGGVFEARGVKSGLRRSLHTNPHV